MRSTETLRIEYKAVRQDAVTLLSSIMPYSNKDFEADMAIVMFWEELPSTPESYVKCANEVYKRAKDIVDAELWDPNEEQLIADRQSERGQ